MIRRAAVRLLPFLRILLRGLLFVPRVFSRRWLRWALPVQVTSVVIFAGVLVSGGYYGSRMYNYIEEDPEFCRMCHLMEKAFDRWSVSEHQDVTCHRCHQQSPIDSMKLLFSYTVLGTEKVEDHAAVPDRLCEKCHSSGDPTWVQVADTAGHKFHNDEQGIACTKCHSTSLHRFTPPKAVCQNCHDTKQVKITQMDQFHCLNCHEFLREDQATVASVRPSRETCLDCHQQLVRPGIKFSSTAPMQFECGRCHKPHVQADPVVNCLVCHQDIKQTGKHAVATHQQAPCQTCHQPHTWTVEPAATCQGCHQTPQFHDVSMTACTTCHQFRGTGAPGSPGATAAGERGTGRAAPAAPTVPAHRP